MNKVFVKRIIPLFTLALFLFYPLNSKSEGISVDAGLTPGQDRIIVRMQYRYVLNEMGGNSISMHMMPVVIAYGLTPDITLMMRNGYRAVANNETMMNMENQWMDPFLMGKVKLFRLNTQHYSFGVAGFAGSSFPVLNSSTVKTYSPIMGINASFRPGLWSFDLNNAYEWVNYNANEKNSEARQLQINLAISRNIEFPTLKNIVVSPVQEFSLINSKQPTDAQVKRFGFISPGFQIVTPHFKFETLYQIGVNQSSSNFKSGNRFIMGIRIMF
jgi:hypothetical protein